MKTVISIRAKESSSNEFFRSSNNSRMAKPTEGKVDLVYRGELPTIEKDKDKVQLLFQGKYDSYFQDLSNIYRNSEKIFMFFPTSKSYLFLRMENVQRGNLGYVIRLSVDKEEAIKKIKEGKFHEVIVGASDLLHYLKGEGRKLESPNVNTEKFIDCSSYNS